MEGKEIVLKLEYLWMTWWPINACLSFLSQVCFYLAVGNFIFVYIVNDVDLNSSNSII